ncbi:glycosyltransferase family 4 protein [Prevotella koreensis]
MLNKNHCTKKVMMVGSAEKSPGGVASVIKTMKEMPFWGKHDCFWLGTQIQSGYPTKLWYALRSYFVALFKIWRYDIIHFHTVADLICLVIQLPVFLLALIGRKKIIMHIHMGNQIGEHTNDRLFNWCMRKADLIIVLAKIWKEKFDKEWFKDLGTPVTYLYNAYSPVEALPYEERKKHILMAAYLNDNKAYQVLFKAFKRIKDDYKDWNLLILGNGEVEKAMSLAKEMGISHRTTFTGYLTGKKKQEVFQHASIYCMCSYQEGFPMVILESWGYGIPVVTTPVGGLPDVLDDGKNALVFPFGDDESLANKLEQLIDDFPKCKEISEYSQIFVKQNFSKEKINSDIEKIYESFD